METQKTPTLTAHEFFEWLFETWNIPESVWQEKTREYTRELPKNTNWAHLKRYIETGWRSRQTPPTPAWCRFNCAVTHIERQKCEAIQKIEQNRQEYLENKTEYDKASADFWADYHKKYGKKRQVECGL